MNYLNSPDFTTLVFSIVCNAQTVKSAVVDMTQNEFFDTLLKNLSIVRCCDTKSQDGGPHKKQGLLSYSGMISSSDVMWDQSRRINLSLL
jgi:hypothetical protein